MRKDIITLIILLSINTCLKSNSNTVTDSLRLCLKNSKTAEDSIDIILELAYEIMLDDSSLTLNYLSRAKNLSNKNNYPEGLAHYYKNLAIYTERKGNYKKATELYNKALNTYTDIGERKEISDILKLIGAIYHKQGFYNKAIEYYDSSLTIAKSVHDTSLIIDISNNMAIAFNRIGKYDTSIYILNKCQELCKNNYRYKIGGIYHTLGDMHRQKGNIKVSLDLYIQAMSIYQETNNKKFLAAVINNIGIIHYYQKDYESATPYFVKALEIAREIGRDYDVAMALNNLGSNYGKKTRTILRYTI